MKVLKTVKDIQSLTVSVAALTRFISKFLNAQEHIRKPFKNLNQPFDFEKYAVSVFYENKWLRSKRKASWYI